MWRWVERCWPARRAVRHVAPAHAGGGVGGASAHRYAVGRVHRRVGHRAARRALLKKVAIGSSIVALPMTTRVACRLVAEWRDGPDRAPPGGVAAYHPGDLPPSTIDGPRSPVRVDEP